MKTAPVPDYANPLVNVAFEQMMSLDKEGGDSVAVSLINSLVPDFQRDPIRSLRPVETDFPFIKGSNSRVLSMDFCGLNERDEQILLELQVNRHIAFDDRVLFYLAKTFSSQKKLEDLKKIKGIPWYETLKKTYSIQIVDYDTNAATGIRSDYIEDDLIARVAEHPMRDGDYMKWFLFADQFSGQTLNKMQLIQVELPRTKIMNLFPPTKDFDRRRWWFSIFNHSKEYTSEYIEQLYREGTMPEEVYRGLGRIKYDKWAPDIRERYMMDAEELYHHWDCPATKALYEAEDKGRAEGIAVGEARGREEKREMVRQLLRNNVDMNVIAISSGLSIEEIESLKAH